MQWDWDQHNLVVTIQDHGHGMAAAKISQIGAYVQFTRRIYKQQGVGLGLVISQYITKLQGGDLNINSQPDLGTTIKITLPLKPSLRD